MWASVEIYSNLIAVACLHNAPATQPAPSESKSDLNAVKRNVCVCVCEASDMEENNIVPSEDKFRLIHVQRSRKCEYVGTGWKKFIAFSRFAG